MDKQYLVIKKRIAEKRVSLLIERLMLKREEEKKYKLTTAEAGRYTLLAKKFSDEHPAEKIKLAIDSQDRIKNLRKDYLAAVKNKYEKESQMSETETNGILIASGMPISVIGLLLLGTFQIPGIAVCVAGGCMSIPTMIAGLFRKKRAKTELRGANNELEELSYKIHKTTAYIDGICNEFHIPVNDPDRNKYLIPLYQDAQEYEALLQKKIDHELFVCVNGISSLKSSIVEDLETLTGNVIADEGSYAGIVEVLDKENKIDKKGVSQC